jgi:hypothetical protein
MQAFFHRRCGFAGVLVAIAGKAYRSAEASATGVCLSPSSSAIDCQQEVVILPCASADLATFLLKTKNTRAVLALLWTLQAGLSVCLCIGCQRSLVSIFVGKELSSFFALVSALPLSS